MQCEGAFIDANSGTVLAPITGGLVWLGYLQLRTTRIQSRAQVYPVGVNSYWEIDQVSGEYRWRLAPTWKNTGETATKQLRVHTMFHIRNQPLPIGFNFHYPEYDFGSGIIAPNSTNTGGQGPRFPASGITPAEIAACQAGQKIIYLYGWARYYDIFPGTREHITRFCWAIAVLGDPYAFVPNDPNHPLTFHYIMHSEGNCADEECG